MAAIIRLTLLLIVVIVVSADFEYTADVEKMLPEYQTLLKNGEEFFKGEALNFEAKVQFTRVKIENAKGVYFYVKHRQTPTPPTPTPTPTPTPKKSQKEKSKAPVECDGLPGIKISLRVEKKYEKKRYRLLLKNPRHVLCLTEMQIDMFPSGYGKSHMRMNMVFKDITKRLTIGIVMNPFKPPTTQANDNHARANNVLRTAEPIPFEEFSKPYFQPARDNNQDRNLSPKQSFLGDIMWMKNVLNRAIFAESIYSGITRSYNEVYVVGPVIIPSRVYTRILQLDNDLKRYGHGEGTTIVGTKYVYANNTK